MVAVGTVGMDIERKAYYEKELDFRISRSYGPGRYDAAYEQKGRDYPIGYVRWTETRNMEAFVQLLAERKIDISSLITHRFPIERAESAYELITGKSREPFLGVVIQYSRCRRMSRVLCGSSPQPVESSAIASDGSFGRIAGCRRFATSTLIPAMKAASATALVAVCAATDLTRACRRQIWISLLHDR